MIDNAGLDGLFEAGRQRGYNALLDRLRDTLATHGEPDTIYLIRKLLNEREPGSGEVRSGGDMPFRRLSQGEDKNYDRHRRDMLDGKECDPSCGCGLPVREPLPGEIDEYHQSEHARMADHDVPTDHHPIATIITAMADDATSDRYCITAPDGNCVSSDPRCMHQPHWRDALTLVDRFEQSMSLIREILPVARRREIVAQLLTEPPKMGDRGGVCLECHGPLIYALPDGADEPRWVCLNCDEGSYDV